MRCCSLQFRATSILTTVWKQTLLTLWQVGQSYRVLQTCTERESAAQPFSMFSCVLLTLVWGEMTGSKGGALKLFENHPGKLVSASGLLLVLELATSISRNISTIGPAVKIVSSAYLIAHLVFGLAFVNGGESIHAMLYGVLSGVYRLLGRFKVRGAD